jgi:hypothetical protein
MKYQLSNKDITRFWSKVSGRENPNGCWLWIAGCFNTGYGQFFANNHRYTASHFSWIIHHGPVPKGKEVMHNCPDGDNKKCVNPAHLLIGTREEHAADRVRKGQTPTGERNARYTHPETTARGSKVGSSKLTEKQVRIALKRLSNGESGASIARDLNCTKGNIYHIKHNRKWKHIKRRDPC